MNLAFRAAFKARLQESEEGGFTLVEVVMSVMLSVILAAAVAAVIVGSLNITTDIQISALNGAQATRILDNFSTTAREAAKVTTATTTELTYTYLDGSQCELHDYQIVTTGSTAKLVHTIHTVNLTSTQTCADVQAELLAGSGTVTTRTEIQNLATNSQFSYYDTTGAQTLVSGNSGFTTAIPLCNIGSVALTLNVAQVTKDTSGNTINSETTQVAFRNNTRGLTC